MVTREEEILLKTHGEQGPAVEVLSSANSHSAKNLEAADLREKSQTLTNTEKKVAIFQLEVKWLMSLILISSGPFKMAEGKYQAM